MGIQKWVLGPTGLLEIQLANGDLLRQKKRTHLNACNGARPRGRPSQEELAHIERCEPIRRQKLYEYSRRLGEAVADAIVTGELFLSLNPKHRFPPARVLREWRKTVPEFSALILEAETLRDEAIWETITNALDNGFAKNPMALREERRGRPRGSKTKSKPMVTVGLASPPPEINWNDIPLVIARFGSWEAAMEYKKKITQS